MKRILIISASAGSGHVTAARAVEQALAEVQAHPGELDSTHIDLLQFSTAFYKMIYRDVYLYMAKRTPLLYGYIFTTSDRLKRQNKPDFVRRFLDSINSRKFRKFILERPWDVIVSTHFLPSQLICELKRRGKLETPLVTVTTDYGLHSYWILPDTDHYIVADEAIRRHLEAMGIRPERIHQFGIPVLPVFGQKKDPVLLRRKLGLDENMPAVLLLAGGFGISPIEHIVGGLVNMHTPFQLVAVAGRNRKLLKNLRAKARELPFVLKPVGYTDCMDEYMKACDIVITKPGGLTTAEALACGLPVMVINPIPGQEDMNSDMLLEQGAGIKAMHPVDVTYKLDQVLSDPRRLASLKRAAARLARPRAAQMTAELIATIAREQRY
jgi:processive 1,2-diacylglycerol beta-glucosyltransferase